jgi:hypothetical protein
MLPPDLLRGFLMPAFASDGTVSCPFAVAWLEFFNADKNNWTASAYKTEECGGGREFTHGSFVAALADGSFPPVFLWDEISYRVVAKGPDGSIVATIDRVTPDAEFEAWVAPVAEESEAAPTDAPAFQSEPAPAPQALPLARTLSLNGNTYPIVAEDSLTLFGALAMAVDGETARITLASGDVLVLTHQDVSDIGRQLAGKPADEVSG